MVVSPRPHFLYTPLLVSSSVGTITLRSACEPLRALVESAAGSAHSATFVGADDARFMLIDQTKNQTVVATTDSEGTELHLSYGVILYQGTLLFPQDRQSFVRYLNLFSSRNFLELQSFLWISVSNLMSHDIFHLPLYNLDWHNIYISPWASTTSEYNVAAGRLFRKGNWNARC